MANSKPILDADLSHIRHELRSPLNAIIGYSEMLIEQAEEEGQDGFIPDLERIHSAGQKLLKLISEMLQPGNLDRNRVVSAESTLDLADLVAELAEMFHGVYSPKVLNCSVACSSNQGSLVGDEDGLFQALFNLVGVIAEETAAEQIDLTVSERDKDRFLFEFKILCSFKNDGASLSMLDFSQGQDEHPAAESLDDQIESLGGSIHLNKDESNTLSVELFIPLRSADTLGDSAVTSPNSPVLSPSIKSFSNAAGIILPESVLTSLRRAARDHNATHLKKHLHDLRQMDEKVQHLAEHLSDLAQEFDMDAILNVLGDIRHE